MTSILSLTGAGNSGESIRTQILRLDPVVWLRAAVPHSLISQGALDFDSPDSQYVEADVAAVMVYPFSIAVWINTTISTTVAVIQIGDKNTPNDHVAILLVAGIPRARARNGAGDVGDAESITNVDDGQWHLIFADFHSEILRTIQVDDVASVSNTTSVTIANFDRTSLARSGDSSPGNYYDGQISQTGIFPGAVLSVAQKVAMYNGGTMIDFATVLQPAPHYFLNDPAAPYLDASPGGSLDLSAFGNTVQNEEQTITITGTPTGGTFTLTFSGQTTGAIAFNASAATVDTALEALSNIDPGDVTCTGGALPGTAVVCEFTGALADTDVVEMTADGSLLTGGASPDAAVTTTQPGHPVSLPTPVAGPEETEAVEGSAIEQWVDQSPNGNTIAQSAVIERPELVKVPWSDGFRPAVRFDGGDDSLGVALAASVSQPFDLFVVFRFRTPESGVNEYVFTDIDGNDIFFRKNNSDDARLFGGAGAINGSVVTANTNIYNCVFDGASTATSLILNGVTDAAGGAGTNTLDNAKLGILQAIFGPGAIDVFEFIIFPTTLLTASEKSLVLNYLRDESSVHWGDVASTGPVGWWSASSTGIKTADDGSGDDVLDGQAVGHWPGLSGNANNVTESTTAQKPTFDSVNPSFSNQSVLAFDGGDNLSVVDPAMDNGVGLTLGFVANITAASADHYLINKAGTYAVWMDSDGEIHVAIGTDGDVFATVLADIDAGIVAGTPFILVVRYVTTSLKLFINGVQKGSEVVTVNGDVLDTAADVIIGASANDGSDGWDGEIAEAIEFNRGISDTEIDNVFGDMGAKYDIPQTDVV